MSGWNFKYSYAGEDREIAGSGRNVSGSAMVSATILTEQTAGAATPLAGVYRFTVETVTTISVAIVHADDSKNPLIYSGTRTVVADGSTENTNLLPGWAIVLAVDLEVGDEFEIGVGCYWDSDNARWVRVLPMGAGIAGFPSSGIEIIAENESGLDQTNSQLVVTNAVRIENIEAPDRPIYATRQTGVLNPTADPDLDGETISFTNFSAGTPNTVDILVDGSPIDVYDVDGDVLIPDGEDLECDGAHVYRFADTTKYQSLEFILSADLTETDTAQIYVSDGGDQIEVATETGSFVDGPTGIDLTTDGEVTGTVPDGESVVFRIRKSPDSGETSDNNARQFSVRISSEGV